MIKKVVTSIVLCAILLCGSVAVYAETIKPLSFKIDDKNVYEGMNDSYKKGYMPSVSDGKATIIIPLIADGDVLSEEIVVTPDLGSTQESPFVYKNYQYTIRQSKEKINGTDKKKDIYLIKLELELKGDRLAGIYPINIRVSAYDGFGSPVSYSTTSYVNIPQTTKVEAIYPDLEHDLNAGDTIQMIFQALNMGSGDIYNVRYELSVPGLIPSGSAYIGNMGPNSHGEVPLKVFVGSKSMSESFQQGDEEYGYTSGRIILIYEDEDGNEYREENIVSTNIHKLIIDDGEEVIEEEKVSAWFIVCICLAAICVLAVTFIIIREKRNKNK